MAKSLRVAFYPADNHSEKLDDFLRKLRLYLANAGAQVISYDRALMEGGHGRIGKGIVLIAPGEGKPGNLAIDHVASLSNNTVVAVLDGTLPALGENRLQKRLNSLVGALVWHMAHVIIYVDDLSWTICNMNGAIDTFSLESLQDRILYSLIPKLAAPVVPLQKDDFAVERDAFDPTVPHYEAHAKDMLAGAELWGRTGLLASQTRMDELAFRNSRYRRIAAAYLSWRTGMSYGFLARQLPVAIETAVDLDQAPPGLRGLDWSQRDFHAIENDIYVVIRIQHRRLLVRVPNISVLCTRSGCEKTKLDPAKDLTLLSLSEGRVVLGTPRGLGKESDCQPSFDTRTILAHALGNAVVASILKKLRPDAGFHRVLCRSGLALAHWHGFLHPAELPPGYYLHGRPNPPVSCSTPQAAIFALSGKLAAMQQSLEEGVEYLGDVHEEPSHGTNLTGKSLVDLAYLVARPAM